MQRGFVVTGHIDRLTADEGRVACHSKRNPCPVTSLTFGSTDPTVVYECGKG
jgi:hypothetical protein